MHNLQVNAKLANLCLRKVYTTAKLFCLKNIHNIMASVCLHMSKVRNYMLQSVSIHYFGIVCPASYNVDALSPGTKMDQSFTMTNGTLK